MNFTLEDLLKIVGILFFIGMCWYLFYTVIDTNKRYLYEFLKQKNNRVLHLDDLSGFFKSSVKEGFEFEKVYDDKEIDKLDKEIEENEDAIKNLKRYLQLDEDGSSKNQKRIKKLVKLKKRNLELQLIMTAIDKRNEATLILYSNSLVSCLEFMEKMIEAYDNELSNAGGDDDDDDDDDKKKGGGGFGF